MKYCARRRDHRFADAAFFAADEIDGAHGVCAVKKIWNWDRKEGMRNTQGMRRTTDILKVPP